MPISPLKKTTSGSKSTERSRNQKHIKYFENTHSLGYQKAATTPRQPPATLQAVFSLICSTTDYYPLYLIVKPKPKGDTREWKKAMENIPETPIEVLMESSIKKSLKS
ncbi:hypothetical protein E3N88_38683 [Mikania micrantha]|uniref:Uncharacterized protein n=1 Tax=Mikania micrantha TaxID=192012 RepID=A0A5N6LUN8_9ASTR|nr:hypothetical protein E3N88_38683 [Mikania micrantha]